MSVSGRAIRTDFVLPARPEEQGQILFAREDRPEKQLLFDIDAIRMQVDRR